MSYSFQNPSAEVIESYLKSAKTIAIVGLSHRKEAASYQVAHFLQAAGYRIIPVNPKLEGQELLGEHVYAYLKDIPFSVDIVDVFSRSEYLPEVAYDFLETKDRVFWSQIGLENEEAETILRQSNRQDIVMNRCTKIEYMRLFV
ncbi:CoA-binding protein [Streptococcus thermophilus]|uniref:CoA-binding protein n=1 Tax=Streptococcus thermophilus TaxID=1308 RepID=UPI003558E092